MIAIADVIKSFGSNQVLRGVCLDIRDGETLTIIGGSGCGKSVLLKNIIGLLKPDQGSVVVDGTDITVLGEEGLSAIQRLFGYLFQGAALFDSLTVGENVAFGLRNLRKMPEAAVRRTVAEKLALVGLAGIEQLKPAELSGGMKKRVGLARAIAADPRFILYDEPTTGLDPIMADVINDLILHLKKQLKVTSIAVTHDMNSAHKISDRIAMLYEGRIIAVGTPVEIQRTDNPVVRQFVTGSSQGPITMKVREYD